MARRPESPFIVNFIAGHLSGTRLPNPLVTKELPPSYSVSTRANHVIVAYISGVLLSMGCIALIIQRQTTKQPECDYLQPGTLSRSELKQSHPGYRIDLAQALLPFRRP